MVPVLWKVMFESMMWLLMLKYLHAGALMFKSNGIKSLAMGEAQFKGDEKMKLTDEGLRNGNWKEKSYNLLSFDRKKVVEATAKNPMWVHFGAGNIFRIFPARRCQELLNAGLCDRGIIVGEGFDYEIISKAYAPFDNLTLMVTLKADGTIDKDVVGSVTEAYPCSNREFPEEWKRFVEIFENPSLQMVSFTITEKGYALRNQKGEFFPGYVEDFSKGPENGAMLFSRITNLLYRRYQNNAAPIALCSMDNCSHNGEKVAAAVKTIAGKWLEKRYVDQGFVDYLNSDKVSYPWSMIDKITPRPDRSVSDMLAQDGFEDADLIITNRNTYTAAFVNAEECEYLVIEDDFPNGRPALEKAGVYFTDRDTVNKVEKMKVCTCLNPLHTALAVYGCLLGYELISAEMKDAELSEMVRRIGYEEGLPVVVDPKIINPRGFIDEVVGKRLPNPFMPDTPQRIATDTSQKLPIRFGETIKAYIREGRNLDDLKLIPLVYSGWMRYVLGIDDEGAEFTPSSDPLLDYARGLLKHVKLGSTVTVDEIEPLLRDSSIFGVDLVEAGLADKVVDGLNELLAGPGAVRATLRKHLA